MAEVKETEKVETKTEVIVDPKMNMEDLKVFLGEAVDKAVKEAGIDKIDLKHGNIPSVEKVNVEGLTEREAGNKKMRAFVKQALQGGFNTKATNSELSGAVGQYAVPVEFAKELSKLLAYYGWFRKNAKQLKMNSQTLTMPRLLAQAVASFTTQGSAKNQVNNTFDQVTFTRRDANVLSPVTNQLIGDSGIDLIAELSDIAGNSLANLEDTQGFTGTGSPITGITAVSGTSEIKLVNQFSNSYTYSKLVALTTAIINPTMGNNAFYMNRSVWGTTLGLTNTATGLPYPAITAGANPSILGYPVYLTDVMTASTTDTTGSSYVIFGDLKNATLATREDFNVQASGSAYVNGVSMFETNSTAFRFEESFDIQIVQPSGFAVLRSAH